MVILFGLSGFVLAWLVVRWRSRRIGDEPAYQPVVLRVADTH